MRITCLVDTILIITYRRIIASIDLWFHFPIVEFFGLAHCYDKSVILEECSFHHLMWKVEKKILEMWVRVDEMCEDKLVQGKTQTLLGHLPCNK